MISVTFKTRHAIQANTLNYTVKRIAQIVCGYNYEPDADVTTHDRKNTPCLKPDQGDNWNLGSNDWFLLFERKSGDFYHWKLSYRYMPAERKDALEGLAKFLEWTFGG